MSAFYTCPDGNLWTEQYDITNGGYWIENSIPMIGSSSSRSYAAAIYFDTPSSSAVSTDCNFLNIVLELKSSSGSANVFLSLCEVNHSSFDYTKYEDSFRSLSALPTDSSRVASSEVAIDSDNTSILLQLNSKLKRDTTYCLFINPKTNSSGMVQLSGKPVLKMAELAVVTVKYDLNGASGTPPASQTGIEGRTITLSNETPKRSPYTSTTTFVITGNANGGDSNTSVTATKTVKTTYEFLGWSKDPDYDAGYYPGEEFLIQTEDVTLYAVWYGTSTTTYSNNSIGDLPTPTKSLGSDTTYTVTLNANGGSVEQSKYTVSSSGSYKFVGWASSATSTTALSSTKTYTSATTVYAIWDDSNVTQATVDLPTPTRGNSNVATYTITLKPNLTGASVDQTSTSAEKYKKYTFLGWGTTSTATTYVDDPYTPTASITLYAIWSYETITDFVLLPTATKDDDETTYTVSLNFMGGSTSMGVSKFYATKTTTYKFKGWGTSTSATTCVSSPYTPTANVRLYGVWESSSTTSSVTLPTPTKSNTTETYTVTLDVQGGSVSNSTLTSTKTTKYSFLGWGTTSTAATYVSSPYTPIGNITLYAIWDSTVTGPSSVTLPTPTKSNTTDATYTVTLDTHGGSVSNSSLTSTKSTSYKFLGWSETSSGTTYLGSTCTPNGDITIFAIWQSTTSISSVTLPTPTKSNTTETYTVTLDVQGGSVSNDSLTSTRTYKYTFLGWGTTSTATTYVSSTYTPTASITLHAIWQTSYTTTSVTLPDPTKNPESVTYVVTLNPNEGTVSATSFSSTKNTSYEFLGWGTSSNSTTYVDTSYKPSGNVTLFAIWNAIVDGPAPITLPDAKRTGYKFLGWGKTSTSGTYVSTNYIPTESITLYAVWKIDGIIHIGSLSALVYVYHNGEWRQSIPNLYNDGSFKVCV